MKRLVLTVALLTLAGCDKEVSRTPHESYVQNQRVSGHHFSYCFTCMPGFDGKMDCRLKASTMCPCSYPAEVRVTPYTITYESGKTREYSSTQVIKQLGSCT